MQQWAVERPGSSVSSAPGPFVSISCLGGQVDIEKEGKAWKPADSWNRIVLRSEVSHPEGRDSQRAVQQTTPTPMGSWLPWVCPGSPCDVVLYIEGVWMLGRSKS